MAFNGKLVEVKISNSYSEFPLKYINANSYKVTPAQRVETSATRVSSGKLVRQTASHTASKIDFSTTPLSNKDVNTIQTLLSSAYTDSLQRMLDIRYYDPSSDSYKTGTVYMPDVDYEISRIDTATTTIWYNPLLALPVFL